MRIVRAARPDYFIFENVKGLFSSSEGRDFELVLREIADAGYDGQWQLLNTRWFLPQNRERIYFVGHLRGNSRPKIFPIGEGNSRIDKDGENGKGQEDTPDVAWALRGRDYKDGTNFVQYGKGSQDTKLSPLSGDSQTLNAGHYNQPKVALKQVGGNMQGLGGKGGFKKSNVAGSLKSTDYKGIRSAGTPAVEVKPVQIGHSKDAWASKHGTNIGEIGEDAYTVRSTNPNGVEIIEDFYPGRVRTSKDCPTLRGDRSGLKVANTVTPDAYLTRGERKRNPETGKAELTSMHERRIRRLTPTECERLQGFPDGWTEGVSDSQRYKCLGNAVSVPVVRAVAERLIRLKPS